MLRPASLKTLEGYTRRIARGDFIDVPVKVADKEIVSLLLAFRRMTNELRVRQQRLVQSEKLASIGTLVAGVAHELNNPLSNKDVGHGTGLGLFLVHDIIQSHGGSITVDSRVGEGTTFIIWLPAQEKKND